MLRALVAVAAVALATQACGGDEAAGPDGTATTVEQDATTTTTTVEATTTTVDPVAVACDALEVLEAFPVDARALDDDGQTAVVEEGRDAMEALAGATGNDLLVAVVAAWDDFLVAQPTDVPVDSPEAIGAGSALGRAVAPLVFDGVDLGAEVASACRAPAPWRPFHTEATVGRFVDPPPLPGLRARVEAVGSEVLAGQVEADRLRTVCGWTEEVTGAPLQGGGIRSGILGLTLLCDLPQVRVAVVTDPRTLDQLPPVSTTTQLAPVRSLAIGDGGIPVAAGPESGTIGSYDPATGVGLLVSGTLEDQVLTQLYLRLGLAHA